jgi:hypothetical protein
MFAYLLTTGGIGMLAGLLVLKDTTRPRAHHRSAVPNVSRG